MSNIALVFNGHSRTFYDHVESLERNIIVPTGCDVIISTWSNIDGGYSQTIKNNSAFLQLSEGHVNMLHDVKNLVKLEINSEDRHREVKNIDRCFPSHIYAKAAPRFLSAGLYARKLSAILLEKHELERGRRYDAVISMTMDACILTPMSKALVERRGTLFHPYPSHIRKGLATSGRIVYGDRDTMRFWLDMYDVFETHVMRTVQDDSVNMVTMENIVARAIKDSGINYDDIGMSYNMHRLNGLSITYDHTRPHEIVNKPGTPCGCKRK